MFSKSIIILAAAGTALAVPQNLGDLAASLTSQLGNVIPTGLLDINSLTSGLTLPTDVAIPTIDVSAANSLLSALSDLPTLPNSIQSVLLTAVPASELTRTNLPCQPTAEPWYTSLPGNVQTALQSYGSALQSWASVHTSAFGTNTEYSFPVCTGTAAVTGSGSGSGSAVVTSVTATGTTTRVTTGSNGVVSTVTSAVVSVVATTSSRALAPQATGAIVGSIAGVVGLFGVMVAL